MNGKSFLFLNNYCHSANYLFKIKKHDLPRHYSFWWQNSSFDWRRFFPFFFFARSRCVECERVNANELGSIDRDRFLMADKDCACSLVPMRTWQWMRMRLILANITEMTTRIGKSHRISKSSTLVFCVSEILCWMQTLGYWLSRVFIFCWLPGLE